MRKELQAEAFDEGALVVLCSICGGKFQHGPHRYGQFIARYQMEICTPCFQAAWDGWGPSAEAKIIKHLAERGIPVPPRNAKGWLPRD